MITRRISSASRLAPLFAWGVMVLVGIAAPSLLAQGWTTAPADAPDPGGFRATPPVQEALIETTQPDRLTPPYHSGWPQTMGTHPNFKPVGVVLADVDADGALEVLAGSTDNLFRVWRHDGTLLPGWPINVGGQVQSKAAAADLDGDGDLEILISVKSGPLRIYHHSGDLLPVEQRRGAPDRGSRSRPAAQHPTESDFGGGGDPLPLARRRRRPAGLLRRQRALQGTNRALRTILLAR